jgi:predicted  nucleic acid-binding Zn-ribbon protein
VKEELAKLIELQKTDNDLRRLKKIIDTASERRAGIEQEFEQHAFSIREIQRRRDELQTERMENEKHLAENKTYLARAERNLKHAQNQKEYESAMRELDALQKQISTFESKIVEIMSAIEEVEKELSDRADEINSLDSKRAEALAAFEREFADAKSAYEVLSAKREAALATLPPDWASTYDRLAQRSRDGIAVAAVVNGSCSACNISLRPQMLVNVRRSDEVIVCENCSRILYIETEPKEAEATAS